MNLHREGVLAGAAPVGGVWTGARAIRLHLVLLAAAFHAGGAVVFQGDVAVLRQGQRLAQPFVVGLRVQRLGGLGAGALPGHQGVVVVAVQGGNGVGGAGGHGVW
jgi:hypothetical protein